MLALVLAAAVVPLAWGGWSRAVNLARQETETMIAEHTAKAKSELSSGAVLGMLLVGADAFFAKTEAEMLGAKGEIRDRRDARVSWTALIVLLLEVGALVAALLALRGKPTASARLAVALVALNIPLLVGLASHLGVLY